MDELLFLVDDSATHGVGQYKWMKCDRILVNLIFFLNVFIIRDEIINVNELYCS
jgi:hypothetical protein